MGGAVIMTQEVKSPQTNVNFTLNNMNSSHQTYYYCLQSTTYNNRKIISSSSNAINITISDLNIRLVNGDGRCSGRVEVYYHDKWGTVCDDDWDILDAQVVCNQLRCGSAVSAPKNAFFGQGSDPTWMDNVKCSGSERDLKQCPHNGFGREDCSHSEDAGVICSADPNIRLANVSGLCSGRVEVYKEGQWGTVCDDNWDINDAEVVCKQLGCVTAISAPGGAYFGQGSDPIWMDDVRCSGNESTLSNCSHHTKHDCNHNEDAGVVCSGFTLKAPTLSSRPSHYIFSPGESIQLICSVPQQIVTNATFTIYMGGAVIMTQEVKSPQTNVTFTLNNMNSSHQTNYYCLQSTTYNNRKIISSSSNAINITIFNLQPPNISFIDPNKVMFWTPQQSVVTRGQSFSITCSIQTQYPGGLFHLYFSGSNSTETKPSVNHSATFTFPVSEYKDQGSYSCSYEVNVSNRTFYSSKTVLMSVNIQASPVPTIGGVVGLLLLLVLLLTTGLIWRNKRSRQTAEIITQSE
ncbi:hypothetical protein UPYG_G00096910 [Umbra pygmaea]|uniref:Deleted in malignant brain tumors 1 protein-like n=1 Tax=Umbra pygmaea TaxID=75934 RepID=A0ABD0XKH7_UMBPY